MITYQCCDKREAFQLLNLINQQSAARWFDADKGDINYATDGSMGVYHRMSDKSIPANIKDALWAMAPTIEGLLLNELVINRYLTGGYIPPHRDSHHYTQCAVLSLTETIGDGLTYRLDNGKTVFNQDKAGQAISINFKRLEHWVLPVKMLRVSVIYLYR